MLRFGILASRFPSLVLLPCHRSAGSCSSAQKPASNSRPLYAGRCLPSHQAPDRLVPEGLLTSGFGDAKFLNDASSVGSLSFVFRMHTCSRSCLELLFQRSPPRLFTAAAWSGLRPAPASRSRGTCPHLSRSFTTLFSPCCFPPFHVSLQHTVAEEVETFLSSILQRGLGLMRVSPSFIITAFVHVIASAARPRLRMTKSSAYATTCARNASPRLVSRQYFRNRFM